MCNGTHSKAGIASTNDHESDSDIPSADISDDLDVFDASDKSSDENLS